MPSLVPRPNCRRTGAKNLVSGDETRRCLGTNSSPTKLLERGYLSPPLTSHRTPGEARKDALTMTGWHWCANFVCLHSVNFSVAKLLVGWDLTQLVFSSPSHLYFFLCVRGFSFFIGTMARYLWCHCYPLLWPIPTTLCSSWFCFA